MRKKHLQKTKYEQNLARHKRAAIDNGFSRLSGSDIALASIIGSLTKHYELPKMHINTLREGPNSKVMNYIAVWNWLHFQFSNHSDAEIVKDWNESIAPYVPRLKGNPIECRNLLRRLAEECVFGGIINKHTLLTMVGEWTALDAWEKWRQIYDISAIAEDLGRPVKSFEMGECAIPPVSILKVGFGGIDEILLSFGMADITDAPIGQTIMTEALVWKEGYVPLHQSALIAAHVCSGDTQMRIGIPFEVTPSGVLEIVPLPATGKNLFVVGETDESLSAPDRSKWESILRLACRIISNFIRGMANETIVSSTTKKTKQTITIKRRVEKYSTKTSYVKFDLEREPTRIRVASNTPKREEVGGRSLAYQYDVAPLTASRWVKEENLGNHEIPLDIKQNKAGTCLFKVLRPVKGWTARQDLPKRPVMQPKRKLTKVLSNK